MRTRKPRRGAAWPLLPLLLTGALMAGCSDDPDAASDAAPDPSESSESSSGASPEAGADGPACAEVWVDGATLPGGYRSCVEEGAEVKPESRPCSFGKPLLTHEGRFWSVPAGRITETDQADLLDDRRYRKVLTTCTG